MLREDLELLLDKYKEDMILKKTLITEDIGTFQLMLKFRMLPNVKGQWLMHVNGSLTEIKKGNEKLLNTKKELVDAELKPQPWESNEISFVKNVLVKLEGMIKGTSETA